MALTKIGTDGVKDDAVTSDKVANSINTAIAANTAKTQTTINNNADNRVITGSGTANTLNGESNVVIDSSGNVGIGTTSPESFGGTHVTLEVAGTGTTQGGVFKSATSDSAGTGSSGTEMLMYTDNTKGAINVTSTDPLTFHTSNTERMRIDSSGKVGIGTTSVSQPLHLANSSGNTIFELQRTDTNVTGAVGTISFTASDGHSVGSIGMIGDGDNEGGHIFFRTTTAAANNDPFNAATPERMRIDSSGNVGIGTSSPNSFSNYKVLTIQGGTSGSGIDLEKSDGNIYGRLFADADGLQIQSHQSGDSIRFETDGGTVRARITSNGLCFNSDTAAANALDDYEEGSWTPTPTAGSFTSATGRYTKIGRLVVATFAVQVNTNQGASFFQFNGFPFDNIASNAGENLASLGFSDSGLNGNIIGTLFTGTALIFSDFAGNMLRYNNSSVSGKIFRGGVTYMSSV